MGKYKICNWTHFFYVYLCLRNYYAAFYDATLSSNESLSLPEAHTSRHIEKRDWTVKINHYHYNQQLQQQPHYHHIKVRTFRHMHYYYSVTLFKLVRIETLKRGNKHVVSFFHFFTWFVWFACYFARHTLKSFFSFFFLSSAFAWCVWINLNHHHSDNVAFEIGNK